MRKSAGKIIDADAFELAPQLTFNLDDDGLTVFDARGGMYWRGNATAGNVMEGVRQKIPVGDVIKDIEQAYGVDAARVRADVHALLDELHRNGIVRRVRP
ncbi:PqqD family protein [Paenarthrobacter sp. NPDC058040]|uniref:PqqD family protein n=1 Tax=unclassified Paenarthrobacter TaxID=2634190 RepID=UPI0036D83D67